ncbi:MAG: hypothetical protein JW942_02190 [Opitutales bacterium]|nr:hypothetical protein [Opitutales bacterium]
MPKQVILRNSFARISNECTVWPPLTTLISATNGLCGIWLRFGSSPDFSNTTHFRSLVIHPQILVLATKPVVSAGLF